MASEMTQLKDANYSDIPLDSFVNALKRDPVRTIHFLVNICEKGMQSRAQVWDRYNRKYRRGARYVSQAGNKSPLYVTNYIYNVVETFKSNLTNNLSALVIQPYEENDDVAADIFTQVLRVAMRRGGEEDATENLVQHGVITGVGWYKPSFDPDAFRGRGELRIDAIAPEDVLILPTCLDYKISPIFIHRVRDVSEAQLKADYKVQNIQGAPETTLIPNERGSGESQRRMEGIKTFNLYEAWVLDYETGKWWIATIAGNTLLREPEISDYEHGRAPFIPWYDGIDVRADQAYSIGVGEIEEIEPLQDLADALDMRIYKNVKQITGRQRVLNPASGIDRNNVDDTPNRVYLCTGRPQDAMMWDNPPSLSSEVYMYRREVPEGIQVVSGIMDVTQGKKPAGIQAARAVSALQGAAAKRIEKKIKSLNKSRQELGDLCSRIIKQYYTEDRIVRLANQTTIRIAASYPPEFEYPADASDEQLSELSIARSQWKLQAGVDLVVSDIDFDYDVLTSTDTALPEEKGERVQLLADLFRLGGIDRRALLDGMDYPDRNKILKRLGENVTGQTPPEAMPENQEGVAQNQINQANAQAGANAQAQMATQAQQGDIQAQLQAMQSQADMVAAAQGAMEQLNPIPVR